MRIHDQHVDDVSGGGVLKRDQAYEAISNAIIRLDLEPSSLIDEAALCDQLGLGRTPIREALQRLMYEGLVTIYPRRGAIVAPISALDAEHLTLARLVCEPGIARQAAVVGRVEDWDALEDVLAKTPPAFASKDDVATGTDIDQQFHRGIAAATGNPYLVEMVDKQLRSRARLSVLFFRHGVFDPATDQHYQILERLRAGDGEAAATLIEQHINLTRGRITHVFM